MAQTEPRRIPPLSVADYLRLDQNSAIRYEYVAGEVFALAGATTRHNRIAGNVFGHLWNAARGTACAAYGSDMRLQVARDAYYYPDVQVSCDPADTNDLYLARPCVVVEVLSPSTETTDRREKLLSYRRLDALQAYIIVYGDRRRVERHYRDDAGAWWHADVSNQGRVPFPCPSVTLSLADIYEGIDLA